jgi:hypothetical protein
MIQTGGCLCGQIRYEVTTLADDVADYCHCTQCRRASGAPVVAWLQVKPQRFAVTRGEARAYASSSSATRWFCGQCGSPVYMTDAGGNSIGITLGTLDNANAVHPTVHGWDAKRLEWFDLHDYLPRFAGPPPYDDEP